MSQPTRITKGAFYSAGGFSNPRLCRRMIAGRWVYFQLDPRR